MSTPARTLISLIGPTAVGKTQLSIELARRFEAPILSCDARQIYRFMDIGTAKPTREEQAGIPHYFIDILNPDEPYSAGQFARDAEKRIHELFETHPVVLLVGGSTLYTHALWVGFDDMPNVAPHIREELNHQWKQEGIENLLHELQEVDPVSFREMDLQNPARVIRALEVFRASGKPISFFRKGLTFKPVSYRSLKIGLTRDRALLYDRINRRVDMMIQLGLVEEVRSLLDKGYSPHLNALQTIGYREVIQHLEGTIPAEEMIRLIKRNSRRYAKRQLTFFRRYPQLRWFNLSNSSQITELQNYLDF